MQQELFDTGLEGRIREIRDRLMTIFPREEGVPWQPIDGLVSALISSRTRDIVSMRAYENLVRLFPTWAQVAKAPPEAIEVAIAEVTNAAQKAWQVIETLQRIAV